MGRLLGRSAQAPATSVSGNILCSLPGHRTIRCANAGVVTRFDPMAKQKEKKLVRTFTVTPRELDMLEALARYHGFSKSATLTNLVKKEFWRVFPQGTEEVPPDPGARITPKESP